MHRFNSKLNEEREKQYWDSIFYPNRFLEPSGLLSAHSSYLLRTGRPFEFYKIFRSFKNF